MRALLPFVLMLAIAALPSSIGAQEGCPERPNCSGCGCKGGPGYRDDTTGKCVGFADLQGLCGIHPDDIGSNSSTCTFENAPNTGLNRWCAFGGDDPN